MGKITRVKARALAGTEVFGFANTGTEQVGFRVEVIDGELAGQSYPWYGYFTDASGARTLEQLKTAGWADDDDGWRAFSEKHLPGLGTTEFELVLEEEAELDESGNETGTSIRPTFINKLGVAMKNQMDANQSRAFADRMRAQFGGPRAPQGQRRAAPTAGQPGKKDDLPF